MRYGMLLWMAALPLFPGLLPAFAQQTYERTEEDLRRMRTDYVLTLTQSAPEHNRCIDAKSNTPRCLDLIKTVRVFTDAVAVIDDELAKRDRVRRQLLEELAAKNTYTTHNYDHSATKPTAPCEGGDWLQQSTCQRNLATQKQ